MPFFLRSVSPERLSVLPSEVQNSVILAQRRNGDTGSEPSVELDVYAHESLVNFIRQLSSLCTNASEMLTELSSTVCELNHRCRLLTNRVSTLRDRVRQTELLRIAPPKLDELQATNRTYSSSNFDQTTRNLLVRTRSADGKHDATTTNATDTDTLRSRKFSKSNFELRKGVSGAEVRQWPEAVSLFCDWPAGVVRMYKSAQPIPALTTLSEYHDGKVDAACFYSDPSFYLNAKFLQPNDRQASVTQSSDPTVNTVNNQSDLSLIANNATASFYDSAYATHSASSSAYGSLRSGAGRSSTRVNARDELTSKMRQLRLEQSGLLTNASSDAKQFPNNVNASTGPVQVLPGSATFNGLTMKQKSVNFNLNTNVAGLAPASLGTRSSVSSTSSSSNVVVLQSADSNKELNIQRPFIDAANPPVQQLVVAAGATTGTGNGSSSVVQMQPSVTRLYTEKNSSQQKLMNQHSRSLSQPPALFVDDAMNSLKRQQTVKPNYEESHIQVQPQPQVFVAVGNNPSKIVRQVSQPPIYAPVMHLQQPQPSGAVLSEHGSDNNFVKKTQPSVDAEPDLTHAVMMNLAMNSGNAKVNYVAPGSTFGQPSAQMLSTIQSILTKQAIGDARAPLVVQSNPSGTLRSTLKLKNSNPNEPQLKSTVTENGTLTKEAVNDIKQASKLRQVSFADDMDSEA